VKQALRLVGLGLLVVPAIVVLAIVFPFAGAGSGKDYQPGMDLARLLSLHAAELFDGVAGIAALVVMGVGVLVLIASIFVPD